MKRTPEPADFESAYLACATEVASAYRRDGEIAPVIYGVTLADQPGTFRSVSPIPPRIAALIFSHPVLKDHLVPFVRMLLEDGSELREVMPLFGLARPDLVMVATEGWILGADLDRDADPREELRKYGGEVRNHPDAQAAILVQVHALGKTRIGFCPVDAASRTVIIGDLSPDDGKLSGRMSITDNEDTPE